MTIARSGAAKARVIVVTGTLAIKEAGPAETVRSFGEVYDQPDDEHDVMLTDPGNRVLLQTKLPPLSKTNFVRALWKGRIGRYWNCLLGAAA